MPGTHHPETIFALSSAPGRAAVAVIRVSGPDVVAISRTLTGSAPPTRTAVVRTLRAPDGETVDQALVLRFAAPHSFTGEDTLELQVHGGQAVVRTLIRVLSGLPNVRPARPGEFTRRALLNGKLDLTQAEAIADLIDSETDQQRRQSLRQYGGALAQAVDSWRTIMLDALALMEADLDFSDEHDVSDQSVSEAGRKVRNVLAALERELADHTAERIRDGFTVVIAGPPNAGKSTLLNWWAGRDAAIVTEIPGTTRDLVEVHLDLAGCPVTLVDSAGIRETLDPVEKIGVARSLERSASADLVIWLDPRSDTPTLAFTCPVILVQSQVDSSPEQPVVPGWVGISVRSGYGLDALPGLVAGKLQAHARQHEGGLITRARHRAAMGEAADHLRRMIDGVEAGRSPELIAEDLRLGIRSLDGLIGRVGVEDVLDRLFASFCIGK